MPGPDHTIDHAISDLERLRRIIKKGANRQVRSAEERQLIRATCNAWFRNHRPVLRTSLPDDLIEPVDMAYKAIVAATDKNTQRSRFDDLFKALHSQLADLRTNVLTPPPVATSTADDPPDFQPLVADPAMRAVLSRRWLECARCVQVDAPLAATVMMGGLLEALLLARLHKASDKNAVFHAAAAPVDKATGKPAPLQEWTLRHYIDVAHELGWISASAKSLGEVVRDYRNYIHPHKELVHGVNLSAADAGLFWEVAKGIARQVLSP
jgi:hypothetical protein